MQVAENLSERLNEALDRQKSESSRRGSIRWLADELRERDGAVSSYSSVHSYVSGKQVPPLMFLYDAAEVLGVRPEWLILDQGEPTAVEEAVGMEIGGAEFGELPNWLESRKGVFSELLSSYALQAPDRGSFEEEERFQDEILPDLKDDLLFLLELPLRSWGFRSLEDLSERERRVYASTVLNALRLLVPSSDAGDEFEDHEASLVPALRRTLRRRNAGHPDRLGGLVEAEEDAAEGETS